MPEHRILDVVTRQQLARWVRDARQRTLELVSDLTDEQLLGPQLAIVNPGVWEIGHHAWFQSRWVLRHAGGQPPVRDDEDDLYDSIAIAHDRRWDLPLPSRDGTLAYVQEVLDRTERLLLADPPDDGVIFHALYSVLHEDMHTEALTYTRQTHGWPAPPLGVPRSEEGIGGGGLEGDVEIPGGPCRLGSERGEPFVFDNEKWAHPVELTAFRIDRAAVSQGRFAEFVDDGGYADERLWSEEGRAWLAETGAGHPCYWRRGDGGWERRHFDGWQPLEPHRPVIHVNWFEADAWCRWAGRRLPTEAEWEAAAVAEPAAGGGLSGSRRPYPWGGAPPSPERANLDWRAMGTVDVGGLPEGDSPWGCRQMIGNVWEWTSTVFGPFPGFEPDPYKEYSEPCFDTRRVMRGGCWTTRSRLIRTGYRNFQTPDRRDVLTGFRTCAA